MEKSFYNRRFQRMVNDQHSDYAAFLSIHLKTVISLSLPREKLAFASLKVDYEINKICAPSVIDFSLSGCKNFLV